MWVAGPDAPLSREGLARGHRPPRGRARVLLDRRPASSGPGTGDLLIASRLEGKVTTWLVAGVSSQLGKSCFLRGMATPPQPHPAPGPAQPRPVTEGGSLGLARPPPPYPAPSRQAAPEPQRPGPCRAPPGGLGPRAGLGGSGGAARAETKQESAPSPQPTPRVFLSVPRPVAISCSLAGCRGEMRCNR